MKNIKTIIVTAIFALCCYANVNAQATEGKIKGKVVTPGDNGMSTVGAGATQEDNAQTTNNAKTPPPVQDWKNNRNIHQYPGGGHAVTDAKSNTNDADEQPQQTAKGIKDPAVKGCGHCPITGKVKIGGNPQATAKDTVGSVEATNKPVVGVGIRAVQHKPGK